MSEKRTRSADTRNKILEISETEFATYGYSGAHLQAIAEQVGVQKTALYYYYPSKAALYNSVLLTMLEALRDTIIGGLERPGTHEERLDYLLGAMNDLLAERPNYSKILFRMFVDRSPFDFEEARPLINGTITPILKFYREGADAGVFRNHSARHFFMSMFGGLFFHYASRDFGAAVLGVDDLFTASQVAWRRKETANLVRNGVLVDRDDDTPGDASSE